MEVYVVTSGSYSDYNIEQVFLTREKALAFIKAREAQDKREDFYIETYETYDECIDASLEYLDDVYAALDVYCDLENGGRWYVGQFGTHTSYEYKQPWIQEFRERRDGKILKIKVELTVKPHLTDDQIIKIAQDEYAKWKAEKEEA